MIEGSAFGSRIEVFVTLFVKVWPHEHHVGYQSFSVSTTYLVLDDFFNIMTQHWLHYKF